MTIEELLKDECNKLTHGHCETWACLRRGGGLNPVDYTKATCDELEIFLALENKNRLLSECSRVLESVGTMNQEDAEWQRAAAALKAEIDKSL